MTTDNDFVAEKLGLWKRGQRCEDYSTFHHCAIHGYYHRNSEDIPAPDLLANPWLLVAALWERKINPVPCAGKMYLRHDNGWDVLGISPIIDGNLPAALLTAAAEMLRQEE